MCLTYQVRKVLPAHKVPQVHKARKVRMGCPTFRVLWVLLVRKALLVSKVLPVLIQPFLAHKALLVLWVLLVQKVTLVPKVHRALPVLKATLVCKAQLVLKVLIRLFRVQWVRKVRSVQ